MGLDLERFDDDRRGPDALARVKSDVHGGLRAGVTATPTLFVDGSAHPGAPEPDLLAALGRPSLR
jgi:predicted DsbA family dithiol-disulfide isomerase